MELNQYWYSNFQDQIGGGGGGGGDIRGPNQEFIN